MIEEFRKLTLFVSEHGWRSAYRKLLSVFSDRIVRRIYHRQVDMILLKDLCEVKDVDADVRYEIGRIGADDNDFLQQIAIGHPEKDIARRLTDYLEFGLLGLSAHLDGQPVGYIWCTEKQHSAICKLHPHLIRYKIELEVDEAYLFDFYVEEKSRGNGNSIAIFRGFENELKRQGFARHWGVVDSKNRPARWLYAMNRHQSIRRMTFHHFFSRFLWSESRLFVRSKPTDAAQSFDYRQVFPRLTK